VDIEFIETPEQELQRRQERLRRERKEDQRGSASRSRSRAFGWERSELRSVLPGKHGLNCVFVQVLAYRTCHLREKVYISVAAEGEEFRPLDDREHSPYRELLAYREIALAALGREESYGEGRELLEARFVCYSPSGSGAAEEAVREIAKVLEELQEFVGLDALARTVTAWKYAPRYLLKTVRDASPGYRPPEGALPHRRDPYRSTKEAKPERREHDA
jgi:hypothetical protein